jgi:hypothetical protein
MQWPAMVFCNARRVYCSLLVLNQVSPQSGVRRGNLESDTYILWTIPHGEIPCTNRKATSRIGHFIRSGPIYPKDACCLWSVTYYDFPSSPGYGHKLRPLSPLSLGLSFAVKPLNFDFALALQTGPHRFNTNPATTSHPSQLY